MSSYLVLAGVILTFLTALIGYFKSRQNADKIQEIHVLVNSQLSAVVARVTQLVSTLEHAGVAVPPNENGGAVPGAEGN